jgi:hypothetical protein
MMGVGAGCASPAPTKPPVPADAGTIGEVGVKSVASSTKTAPAPNDVKTMWVKEDLVDCEGEGPMKCMQVRAGDAAEWSYFYSRIEGFEHEPGFRYELRVKVTPVGSPAADASSLRYELVEVVSKTATP